MKKIIKSANEKRILDRDTTVNVCVTNGFIDIVKNIFERLEVDSSLESNITKTRDFREMQSQVADFISDKLWELGIK